MFSIANVFTNLVSKFRTPLSSQLAKACSKSAKKISDLEQVNVYWDKKPLMATFRNLSKFIHSLSTVFEN